MAVILEAASLACGYPGREVLTRLDLQVQAGEVVGLVGANGSGKTTLVKTLVGILAPRGGSVRIEGRDAAELTPRERAREVGYVPQAARPSFPYRVVDFVLLGRAPHVATAGRPTAADERVAREALAEMGVADLAGRAVTQLSGGQLQLVLMARALAQEPRALVLDEPAASLDFGHQMHLLSLLTALTRRGMAVLMSTHHPDHVLSACQRVVLLSGGGVLAQGTPAEALTPERLEAIYGVPVAVVSVTTAGGHTRQVCVPGAR